MTKNDFALLTQTLGASKAPHPIRCTETWNGFEAGLTYQAEINAQREVYANDKFGIPTAIGSGCTFFELAIALPSPQDTARSERTGLSNKLIALSDHLLTERETYLPGQLVEFIPGMDNFKDVKLFRVIEQVDVFVAKPDGNPWDSSNIELLDLRVAYIRTVRDGTEFLLEGFLDSRRVRLAEGL